MTIRLDNFGRILIPKRIRKQLGLAPGSELELDVDGDEIRIVSSVTSEPTIKRVGNILVVCGDSEDVEVDFENLVNAMRSDRIDSLTGKMVD